MEDYEYYIHTQYIGESGWSGQTWDWLMGTIGWSTSATLVDIINSIWNVASNAVTIVKDAVTNVLNAVKSGLEWIANSVIAPIIDAFVSIFNNMVDVISQLATTMNIGIDISFSNNILNIEGNEIEIFRENTEFVIRSNDLEIGISNIFIFPSVETLFAGQDIASTVQTAEMVSWLIGAIGIGMVSTDPSSVFGEFLMVLMGSFSIIKMIQLNNLGGQTKKDYLESMMSFHFASMIGFLISLTMSFAFPTVSDIVPLILSTVAVEAIGLLLTNSVSTFIGFSAGLAINLLGAIVALKGAAGVAIAQTINMFMLFWNLMFFIIHVGSYMKEFVL